MKTWKIKTAVVVVAAACGVVAAAIKVDSGAGADMTTAAQAFVASLDAQQKQTALIGYDDPNRLDWHFIPKDERKGLQIKHMTAEQRSAAHALMRAALSQVGYDKAVTIMELEKILHALKEDPNRGAIRDPQRYYFTVFGAPGEGRWGLSVEGHHLSQNFVVEGGKVVSHTPSMFGTNPAEVMSSVGVGPGKGTRVLMKEEVLAFQLLRTLTAEQRKVAILADKAPREVRAAGEPQPPGPAKEGLSGSKMTPFQRDLLYGLIVAYAQNMPEDVAAMRQEEVKSAGLENIYFAWAGPDEPGIGHYYRIEGPTLLIELVNTQPDAAGNPANHVHAVWRDIRGDFGLHR